MAGPDLVAVLLTQRPMTGQHDAPNRDDQDTVQLHDGRAVVVVLDGLDRVVWWGSGGDTDRMATADGRVLTWATVQACRDHANAAGWVTGTPPDADGEVHPEDVVDCHPAQAWLRQPGAPLDHVSALGLWNLHWDVVASRTGAYPVLSRVQARCHSELTVANVSWLADEEIYRPRWTAADLRCLRAQLSTPRCTLCGPLWHPFT